LDKSSCSSTKTISSVIDDVADYEIPWEDLHIGERIGLGICINSKILYYHLLV
jgi:sterile alpha motif and leucine zipper-containing kinase AZK